MKERILAALVMMVVHNKKTTLAGLSLMIAIVAARLELDLTADQVATLAGALLLFLGLVAGDTHLKRGIR